MAVVRITPRMGAVPKLEARTLEEGAAQEAANLFLTANRIDVMSKPKSVALYIHNVAKTIYRMFNNQATYWLSWKEQVDIAESPVYVENNFRIAFTSPEFEPRQTDLTLASEGAPLDNLPANWYVLGVTPPLTKAVIASVVGDTGPDVSRIYLYTFVTTWGEESAPSPVSEIFIGKAAGVWNISIPDLAPPNSYAITDVIYAAGQLRLTVDSVFGLRAKEVIELSGLDALLNAPFRITSVDVLNKFVFIKMPSPGAITDITGTATRKAPHNIIDLTKRVYRSITTADGTQYFLVGSGIPAATTTFADNAEIIGEPIPSIGWAMPPPDLEGITVHPSGAMMGFVGNQVYISEPYSPYAWPLAYINVLDFPIVAISISGQSAIIGTEGKPYVLTFSDPISATPQKLDNNWPCLSKLGMIAFNAGVYYPTNLGLAYIGSGGTRIVTEALYAQRNWDLVNPRTFKAAAYDNRYYAIYENQNTTSILVISEAQGIVQITVAAEAVFTDRETGEIYIAQDKKIQQLNSLSEGNLEYSWTSKVFTLADPTNLGVAKLDFNKRLTSLDLEAIAALNALILENNTSALVLGGDFGSVAFNDMLAVEVAEGDLVPLIDASLANYCVFALIVDGKTVYQTVVDDTEAFRLPSGFKYDNFAVRLSGTAEVTSVVVATTASELKRA